MTAPEKVPLFGILEESLMMILGDEFDSVVFDRQQILSDEEADYVRGFARPYAVAMLFKSLLRRLKAIDSSFTAERLKPYFSETTRDVYWLHAEPDANERAEQLVNVALGFLEFNLVFDIDNSLLEPNDEPSIDKFLAAVFPDDENLSPPPQNKIAVATRFAKLIEEKLDVVIGHIFARVRVTG